MSADLEVRAATGADAAAWDAYVSSRPDATGYHEWAWRGVFSHSFGHECVSLLARRADRVSGVLPLVHIRSRLFGRTMTSLPFVNYGGVLADDEPTGRALLAAAADAARARRCRHVELRHVSRHYTDLPCRRHKVAMRLPLAAGLWDRFDRKVRNQIRKAQKSGLVADRGGIELVDDFYAVFARNMRDLGTPVYAKGFFEDVLRAFPDRADVVVVRAGLVPVAAGISYRTDGLVEVPWASSLREYNVQCPNHLLYWTVIGRALETGCHTLDFGRSTPNEGTYRFKAQWGAEPVPLTWEYVLLTGGDVPDQSPANPKFRVAIAAWRRLPLWVANAAGPRIVRGIP